MLKLSDEDLVASLCAGQDDALTVLFQRYHRLVLSVALRTLQDVGEARDSTQEVFLDLYRNADRFDREKGSARMWILRSAYRMSLQRRRYLAVRRFYDQENLPENQTLEDGQKPSLAPVETSHLVRNALGLLKPVQRRTIELHHFGGFSMREIAGHLGVSIENVRHYYYRGLRKMRSHLEARVSKPISLHPEEVSDVSGYVRADVPIGSGRTAR